MKKALFILLLFIGYQTTSSFFWNPFPKRLLGTYVGNQEAYKLLVDQENIDVPSSSVTIELINYEKALIRQGQEIIKVNYEVKDKTKLYYNLDVTLENNERENWQLFRKGKKIIRPERAPRPSVVLLQGK
jgi:hypothetical protein